MPAITPGPGHRRGTTLAVGTAAAAAIAIGVLLLVNAGSAQPTLNVGTVSLSTAAVTQCCRLSETATRGAEEAMVSLETSGARKRIGCGVVLGDGSLVATATTALGGARQVRAVAATGQTIEGTVVGSDPESGIALVQLPMALPPARIGGDSDVGTGSPALALVMRGSMPVAGQAPRAVWTSGTVVSLDGPGPGGASAMATIVVQGASVPSMPGEPLVGLDGKVAGILVGASGEDRAFMPMDVVAAVSDEIDTTGEVRHGWLDVTATTPVAGTTGALVVSVEQQGASTGILEPGDVILAVDGSPVRSAADLRSTLYMTEPGTKITVEARRDGQTVTTVVRLSASP